MLIQNDVEYGDDFVALCGRPGDIKTPILNVIGSVEVPNPCYQAELKYHVPQGINPKILLLSLEVTYNGGICPEVVTRKPVGYSMLLMDCSQYDQVHIVETGQTIDIIKY